MKPNLAIIEEHAQSVVIDRTKATYQGMPWLQLGDGGKRKFDNLVFLLSPNKLIKILYV